MKDFMTPPRPAGYTRSMSVPEDGQMSVVPEGTAPGSTGSTVQVGEQVPDFSARSDDGAAVTLSAWRGRWVVLFFFPSAATTHCQMQARRFQALAPAFAQLGGQLLGVSVDSRRQHTVFRDVCRLSFPLVSDARHAISARFGLLEREGQLSYARRTTYLIDPAGQLAQRWDDVSPNTNAAEVLDELRSRLSTESPPSWSEN